MGESTNQTTGSRVDRLGPGDLTMLLTDRGQVPMNTGAILVFDAAYGPGPAALRAVLADRVAAIPRLRQRVQRLPMGAAHRSGSTTRNSPSTGTSSTVR